MQLGMLSIHSLLAVLSPYLCLPMMSFWSHLLLSSNLSATWLGRSCFSAGRRTLVFWLRWWLSYCKEGLEPSARRPLPRPRRHCCRTAERLAIRSKRTSIVYAVADDCYSKGTPVCLSYALVPDRWASQSCQSAASTAHTSHSPSYRSSKSWSGRPCWKSCICYYYSSHQMLQLLRHLGSLERGLTIAAFIINYNSICNNWFNFTLHVSVLLFKF